jgi:hypothetical protein
MIIFKFPFSEELAKKSAIETQKSKDAELKKQGINVYIFN